MKKRFFPSKAGVSRAESRSACLVAKLGRVCEIGGNPERNARVLLPLLHEAGSEKCDKSWRKRSLQKQLRGLVDKLFDVRFYLSSFDGSAMR